MPFHLSQFVSARLNAPLQEELHRLPDLPADLRHCLLAGPERSGKTALLFHYAHSVAAAGCDVIFICKCRSLDVAPPALPAGVSKDDPAFSNIKIRYLNDLGEVKRYAAALHLMDQPPAAVIVDDLSKFDVALPGDRQRHDTELIKALCYLHDAVNWSRTSRADGMCHLLVSDLASAEGPRMLFLYKKWLPCVLQITVHAGISALALAPEVFDHHLVDPENQISLVFSIATHSILTLNSIEDQ